MMEWDHMRASLFVFAAAIVLAAAVPPSGSASAQGVAIEGPGVGVRIGDPDRRRDRHWREERRRERVTIGGEGCRTVTVKERLPNGTTVVRRRSTC
jgi:hypothetical protein